MRTCPVCHAMFEIPTDRAQFKTYCSASCNSKAAGLRYTLRHPKQCPGCDSTNVRYNVTYCTSSCKQRHINKHKALVHVPWNQVRPIVRTQSELRQQIKTRTFYAGNCKHCGDAFVSTQPSTDHCSAKCGQRAARQRRRAVERAAFIENVYRYQVFERDDYVCQLCMKPCRRDVDVQHMQAATVDHVVALANGGQHSMSNVQTAHRLCNSLKSDRLDYSAA